MKDVRKHMKATPAQEARRQEHVARNSTKVRIVRKEKG